GHRSVWVVGGGGRGRRRGHDRQMRWWLPVVVDRLVAQVRVDGGHSVVEHRLLLLRRRARLLCLTARPGGSHCTHRCLHLLSTLQILSVVVLVHHLLVLLQQSILFLF